MRGQAYAVGSGLLASIASMCGKVAMARTEAEDVCEMLIVTFTSVQPQNFCDQWVTAVRVVSFVLMLSFNCVMWTTFTKALRHCTNSVEATITNTAANFLFTAVVGEVMFGEVVTGLWWVGVVLILCGLLLLHHTNALKNQYRKPGTIQRKKEKIW